jgi:hypothetical protein
MVFTRGLCVRTATLIVLFTATQVIGQNVTKAASKAPTSRTPSLSSIYSRQGNNGRPPVTMSERYKSPAMKALWENAEAQHPIVVNRQFRQQWPKSRAMIADAMC